LIHGLVRDAQGRKMSKSLGNGVDPMDVIEQYGADALRFFLTTNSTPGQDLRYMEEKVEAAWNFINKLWNASRFVLMNLEDDVVFDVADQEHASFVDQWIMDKLNHTIISVTDGMEKYEFSMVGHTLVNFIWDDFCSWYIELSKITLSGDDLKAKRATQHTLYVVLEAIVKLLHPFMPFVSEEIFQSLTNQESVCISQWPTQLDVVDQDFSQVDQLISMISTVRELRLSKDIKKDVDIFACAQGLDETTIQFDAYIGQVLKRIVNVTLLDDVGSDVLVYPIVNGTLLIKNEGLEDKEKEINDIDKQLAALAKELKRSQGMLSNTSFLEKAKPEKIEQEKEKFAEYQRQYDILKQKLELLKS
jgi:valyl-tRNA synthetase